MDWHNHLAAQLSAAESQHLRRYRNILDGPQGARVVIGGQQLTNFSSNDYLGFANHPLIAEAVINAAKEWGVGSGASHLVCGHQAINQKFEADFSDFVEAESAVLFSTGYMANFAVLNSFFDRDGLILQDKLNHASLIDAGRLSRAELKRYKHLDMEVLERQLVEKNDRLTLVATDAVFSMDGDMAPIHKISELAKNHGAIAYFDDAHGFGVLGKEGKGSLNAAGMKPQGNNLVLATMGKAMGSFGAVVAGDKVFIDSLIQNARPYIYTTALPPTVVAANASALNILQEENWRLAKLHKLIQYFRESVLDLNLDLMQSDTAIQPLIIGSNDKALSSSQALRELGFLVTAIRPPTVPVGTARLRITLTANHSIEDVDRLCEALALLKQKELV